MFCAGSQGFYLIPVVFAEVTLKELASRCVIFNVFIISVKVARMEEGRSAFKILTGKRLLGRPRHRWEDNIRMDLKVIHINMRN